jgi:hypothetical protein
VRPILLPLLFIFSATAYAHQPEDGSVYASLGPYIYQTHRYHEQFEAPWDGGFGLVVEGDLNEYGGLEITLIYMKHLFGIEREDRKLIESQTRMYIATGWRHWFNRRFSVSPSFFSSYVMGDAEIIRSEFPPTNPPRTSARDAVDYGIGLSAQAEVFQKGKFALVIDGRYSWSATAKHGEDMNVYGLLVTLKYFVQGKAASESDEI